MVMVMVRVCVCVSVLPRDRRKIHDIITHHSITVSHHTDNITRGGTDAG